MRIFEDSDNYKKIRHKLNLSYAKQLGYISLAILSLVAMIMAVTVLMAPALITLTAVVGIAFALGFAALSSFEHKKRTPLNVELKSSFNNMHRLDQARALRDGLNLTRRVQWAAVGILALLLISVAVLVPIIFIVPLITLPVLNTLIFVAFSALILAATVCPLVIAKSLTLAESLETRLNEGPRPLNENLKNLDAVLRQDKIILARARATLGSHRHNALELAPLLRANTVTAMGAETSTMNANEAPSQTRRP